MTNVVKANMSLDHISAVSITQFMGGGTETDTVTCLLHNSLPSWRVSERANVKDYAELFSIIW